MIFDILTSQVAKVLGWIVKTILNAWPVESVGMWYDLEGNMLRLLSGDTAGAILGLVNVAYLTVVSLVVFLVLGAALVVRLILWILEWVRGKGK